MVRRREASMCRRRRFFCDALVTSHELASVFFHAVFFLLTTSRAEAADAGSRLVLRGMARIDAHVARSHGKMLVRGTVTDDRGAPTPGVRVAVQLTRAGADAISFAAFGSATPEACGDVGDATQTPVLERPDRIVVTTDDDARFCVRLAVPAERYVARLDARTSGLVDGAHVDVPIDLTLETVTLRFDAGRPLRSLSLDDATTPLDVLASSEDDGITAPAERLPLKLTNESGTLLGEAMTDSSGRARFVVQSARLGPPGRGELRVSFAGSAEAGGASYVAEIERHARVQLEVPGAIRGALPRASPEDGIALRIAARFTCFSQGCVGLPTGVVEVRTGADGEAERAVLGVAPVERGEARVVATFAGAGTAAQVPLIFRYLPDAPWFEAGEPLQLLQPMTPPSPWHRIALAAAGVFVVSWLGAGRLAQSARRSPRSRPSFRGGSDDDGRRPLDVVRADASASGTWSGRVVDAHEGTTLAATRLAIERPGFEGSELIAEATSDAGGRFVLVAADVRLGDQLVAESPLHATARMPMPPCGEIQLALVARRRALLDRLVGWARRRGRPFDARPEPTPAHIRRAARTAGAGESVVERAERAERIETWADAVERAAYAGAPVDAGAEAEVNRLAPGDAVPPRNSRPR